MEEEIVKKYDQIIEAERAHKFKIQKYDKAPTKNTRDLPGDGTLETTRLTPTDLIAVVEAGSFHLLPKANFVGEYNFNQLQASALFLEFGSADEYDLRRVPDGVFLDGPLWEWKKNANKYSYNEMIDFINGYEDLFKDYYMTLPTKRTRLDRNYYKS